MLATIYKIIVMFVKNVAALPPLQPKDATCFALKTSNCEQLISTYTEVIVKATKLLVAAYWVFFVLGLSYNNYNLLFTMKYWTLSQKLESLILHE